MSEILSKSMHMSGASAASSVATKTETSGDDLLFAALFGGATGDISTVDDQGDTAVLAGVLAVQTNEQDDPENPPQEALLEMIAALQAVKGFDQKQDGKANDVASEKGDAASVDKNSDALGDMIAAIPLSTHINPVNGDMAIGDGADGDVAEGVIADQLQNTKSIRTNMAFENGKSSSQATGNQPKIGAGLGSMQGQMQGPMAKTTPIMAPNGSAKPVGELAATGQAAPSQTFIGPMPDLSSDAKTAANIANLRAIRTGNLEQRNAEINAKLSDDDAVNFTGKSDKAITTVASLKQTLMTDGQMLMGDKMLARVTAGIDMARQNQAPSILADSASGANGQSLSNQTGGQAGGQAGGQTGGQSGGQAGAASGGGLLNNLNMLQTLDIAKNNWTEMLLQRVQKGLAGGKDQMDFQLNPRNLGKMKISLVIQNDRTNIQIQTETSAAASMLSESEARLAQMLEASGLRLGNLNSGQSQGFGGNKSGGHANQQNQAENSGKVIAGRADDDSNSVDVITERSENLINIQA
ncbi:flagellar hook-length control protein FliK [Alphaproteobacteria bacterium]|nr:flagellar hook-length control protein FliK [Alphaproteobacteria bacterium]